MTLNASVSALRPSLDGQSVSHSVHLDAVVDGSQTSQVVIPGGHFLLTADFHRTGSDLLLTGNDGHQVVVAGYFSNHPPTLIAEAGGVIEPDLAFKLTGPLMHGAMAQASGNAAVLTPIGVVDKIEGSNVTVKHNDGSADTLAKGGTVYQGDVLETHDGNIGLIFADKTTFSLGPNGRMVMDEMVYDPKTHGGHSAFQVVQGTFSFVSGQIAKSGPDNMTVKTPVMTIGIRGTTVVGTAAAEGSNNTVSLLSDAGGGVGQIVISNQGGTQVLSVPGHTVQMASFFTAPPAPTVVPPQQLAAAYQGVLNARPTAPTGEVVVPAGNHGAPGSGQGGNGQNGQKGSTEGGQGGSTQGSNTPGGTDSGGAQGGSQSGAQGGTSGQGEGQSSGSSDAPPPPPPPPAPPPPPPPSSRAAAGASSATASSAATTSPTATSAADTPNDPDQDWRGDVAATCATAGIATAASSFSVAQSDVQRPRRPANADRGQPRFAIDFRGTRDHIRRAGHLLCQRQRFQRAAYYGDGRLLDDDGHGHAHVELADRADAADFLFPAANRRRIAHQRVDVARQYSDRHGL